MSGGFQTQVNTQPAPAVAGDFADANPRWTVLAGPGGLVAGPAGVTIGRFAWVNYATIDADGGPASVANTGSGPVAGFVHREQQGLITAYLADAGMVIPQGFPVTLHSGGGFWMKNDGSGQVTKGMLAYANYADGKATFAAAGAAGSASGSASSIAASTFSVTASIAGNVLTVTAVGSGTVVPGATISGTNVATGTMVMSQLSGTTGGVGTYAVNIPEQTVASTTVSGTYGTMTVGGTVAGTFGVGDTISGTSVVAGTAITALGTGVGVAGTYIVNNNTVVSSTAITAGTQIQTKWVAQHSALAGELVKISSHVEG